LFCDEAILAIHQGSGGLLRRANLMAKGALVAAANEKCQTCAEFISVSFHRNTSEWRQPKSCEKATPKHRKGNPIPSG
jgi:hypothetical protein